VAAFERPFSTRTLAPLTLEKNRGQPLQCHSSYPKCIGIFPISWGFRIGFSSVID
jgi:hypothetical protein